ncbi:MAG TPA: hypothetical protein VLM89_16015, partial [Phycisphaerae bacterium]|nr:hypothetical protein [Phycisphaerae bacterium]
NPTNHADLLADRSVTPNLVLSTLLDNSTGYGLGPGITAYSNNRQVKFFYIREGNEIFRRDVDADEWYCLKADPVAASGDNRLYWWRLNTSVPAWERQAFVAGIMQTISATFLFTPPIRVPLDGAIDPFNWMEWFYIPGTQGASRVLLDPNPPPGRSNMMSAYFLPGCSEFKVEFTYDDPREIAVDENTRRPILTPDADNDGQTEYDMDGTGVIADTDNDGVLDAPRTPAPQPINWQSLPSYWEAQTQGVPWQQVRVWNRIGVELTDYADATRTATTPPSDLRDRTQPFRWPRAIRITIRAYDPAGRLDDPITYTIVHCWQ